VEFFLWGIKLFLQTRNILDARSPTERWNIYKLPAIMKTTKFTDRRQVSDRRKSICKLCDKMERPWTCPNHLLLDGEVQGLTKQRRRKRQTAPPSCCNPNPIFSELKRLKTLGVRRNLFSCHNQQESVHVDHLKIRALSNNVVRNKLTCHST
jgi:hypothetical protein